MSSIAPSNTIFFSTVEYLRSVNGNVPLMKQAADVLLEQVVPVTDMIKVDFGSVLKMFLHPEHGDYTDRLTTMFFNAAVMFLVERPEIRDIVEELNEQNQMQYDAAATLATLATLPTARRSERAKSARKLYTPEKGTVARRGSKSFKRALSVTVPTVSPATVAKRARSLAVGTVSQETTLPEVRRGGRARTPSSRYSREDYSA